MYNPKDFDSIFAYILPKEIAEVLIVKEPPDVIYLFPGDEGYMWCEDAAPGADMDPKDSIKYVKVK
jgi:hypothetical protein